MLNFIANVATRILGLVGSSWQAAIRSVVTAFRDLFTTFHNYWHTVASHAIGGWQALTRDILLFEQGLQRLLFAQYAYDVLIIKHVVPSLSAAITALGRKLVALIDVDVKMLERKITAGDNAVHSYARSILVFVLVHVLLFLYNILRTVVSWVTGAGATMWHYFSHLDAFALLLFWHFITALESLAWDAGKRLGQFFLSLIVHNMVKFATLVETIVDAVL